MSSLPESPRDHTEAEFLDRARTAFTACLPKIRALAHAFHRRLDGDLHDEAVAETEAFAWKAFRKLTASGRDPVPLAGKITEFAARRVRAGARFAGKVPVQDALSAEARRRQGYHVTSLPSSDEDQVASEVRDALRQHGPSPADEAIHQVDYEAWLSGLDDKYRAVAEGLASGLNTREVADVRGVSKARIQQMASRLQDSWDAFHGERGR